MQALPLHQQATAAVAEWRAALGVGSEVDAMSFRDDMWYAGQLQDGGVDEDEGRGAPRKRWVVRFKRFSVKHNEAYAQAGADLLRLAPPGSHSAPLKASQLNRKKRSRVASWSLEPEVR